VYSKTSVFKHEEYVEPSISLLTGALDSKLQQAVCQKSLLAARAVIFHIILSQPTASVNLSSWLHYFSMDVIGEVVVSLYVALYILNSRDHCFS